jgi:hypothetical protein
VEQLDGSDFSYNFIAPTEDVSKNELNLGSQKLQNTNNGHQVTNDDTVEEQEAKYRRKLDFEDIQVRKDTELEHTKIEIIPDMALSHVQPRRKSSANIVIEMHSASTSEAERVERIPYCTPQNSRHFQDTITQEHNGYNTGYAGSYPVQEDSFQSNNYGLGIIPEDDRDQYSSMKH